MTTLLGIYQQWKMGQTFYQYAMLVIALVGRLVICRQVIHPEHVKIQYLLRNSINYHVFSFAQIAIKKDTIETIGPEEANYNKED